VPPGTLRWGLPPVHHRSPSLPARSVLADAPRLAWAVTATVQAIHAQAGQSHATIQPRAWLAVVWERECGGGEQGSLRDAQQATWP
jgi:hypothetical protein